MPIHGYLVATVVESDCVAHCVARDARLIGGSLTAPLWLLTTVNLMSISMWSISLVSARAGQISPPSSSTAAATNIRPLSVMENDHHSYTFAPGNSLFFLFTITGFYPRSLDLLAFQPSSKSSSAFKKKKESSSSSSLKGNKEKR